MNEATQVVHQETPVARRAAALWRMLKDERWSQRQVAIKIGASHRYINDRMNGQVDLSFSDVQAIAPLLRMTGVELFAALNDAADGDPKRGGGLTPAGWWFESTSGSNDAEIVELHPLTGPDAPEHELLAPVTTLHA